MASRTVTGGGLSKGGSAASPGKTGYGPSFAFEHLLQFRTPDTKLARPATSFNISQPRRKTSHIYARFETTYTPRPFFPYRLYSSYTHQPALSTPGFVNNYTAPDTGRLLRSREPGHPERALWIYFFDPPALDGLLKYLLARRSRLVISTLRFLSWGHTFNGLYDFCVAMGTLIFFIFLFSSPLSLPLSVRVRWRHMGIIFFGNLLFWLF